MTEPQALARVLADPDLARITFTYGPTTVRPGDYQFIAGRFVVDPANPPHKPIAVREAPPEWLTRGGGAFYSRTSGSWDDAPEVPGFEEDTLYLSSHFDLTLPQYQGLLVHEATHALQDDHCVRGTYLEAEVAAFTAQGCFYLAKGMSWLTAVTVTNPALIPLRQAAWDVASALWRTTSRVLTDEAAEPLRAAIRSHPQYGPHVDDTFHGDGLRH